MSSPAPVSAAGSDVKIGSTSIPEILNWQLAKDANVKTWTSNSTGGGQASAPSKRTFKVTLKLLLDTFVACPIVEGAQVVLKLYVDATHYYTAPVTVGTFGVTADINESNMVEVDVTCEANGLLVEPTWG